MRVLITTLVTGLAASLTISCASDAPPAQAEPCTAPLPAADTATADGWVGYLAQHRDDVSVVLDDGRGGRLSHRATDPMPTASVAKLIHLAAFSAEVAAGRIDPNQQIAVGDWQRWYVTLDGVGLDGGAHVEALKYLGIPARDGVPLDLSRTVSLAQLADVMTRFSDSAAPDELRARMGDGPLQAVMSRYGFPGTAPSFQGLYRDLIANGTTVEQLEQASDRSYAAPADAIASLIGDLATGRFGPAADGALRFLEFAPQAPEGLTALGFKGGSLPGIVTEAFEGRRPDGSRTVGVLMVRRAAAEDLRKDTEANLPHQSMLIEAMTDPADRQRIACAVGAR